MNGPVVALDFADDGRPRGIPPRRAGRPFGAPRAIPAKFLYDARGSALFDEICELPEYYLTRTETGILRAARGEIGRRWPDRAARWSSSAAGRA